MTTVSNERASGSTFTSATRAIARRSWLVARRSPSVLLVRIVQSVVFLLVFRFVFGGAIATGGLSYVDFMAPGLLVVTVLFTVMGEGSAVAEDVQRGVIDRFRSLPMPPPAVLVGRAVVVHLLTLIVLLATAGVAVAVGFRPRDGAQGLLLLLALCMAAAVAFTWVFLALGLAVRNSQAAQGLGFLVMPLTFVSSAYVPVQSMPDWLAAFARNQPVTVLVNAGRYLAHGGDVVDGAAHSGAGWVVLAMIWCLGILAVSGVAASALFSRR